MTGQNGGERRKPVVVGPTGKKRLSCFNCRKRRKKCDLAYPCGNCKRLDIQCNVNEEDLRKKRYTSRYVQSLESHVATLESNLKNVIEKFYPNNPQEVLDSMMIGDVVSGLNSNDVVLKTEDNIESVGTERNTSGRAEEKTEDIPLNTDSERNIAVLSSISRSHSPELGSSRNGERKKKTFVKGSLYPEGPVTYKPRPTPHTANSTGSLVSIDSLISSNGSTSSIANNDKMDENHSINDSTDSKSKERISDLKTTVIKRPSQISDSYALNNDPNILQALSNFYRWLYPGHFIFVHRESFLYGFFNHSENNYENSHYCSTELVYAMCAVGSRLSPELQDMSEVYYEKSKTTLLKLVFDETNIASITTVQALFCLAFYELGKGNNQLAWYFSGLAIRVGYDMGFQLDPQVWYTETDDSRTQLTKSELEIRSRIYWGCYIADHFICLMLGRTSTLSVSNSTIPESDELPEVEGTEEFRFIGKHVLQISLPLKNLIILSRIVQIFTSKIFIESDETSSKIEYLNKFNLQVYSWRQSLPDFLQWNKILIQDDDVSTDPTLSYFWYYYYIVRLTFNKPFIDECEESKIVVVEIVDDLKALFTNFNNKFGSYQRATLYQLYSCLLAINCLKKLTDLDNCSANEINTWNDQLNFFQDIFENKLYPSYELPKKLKDENDGEVGLDLQEGQLLLNQVNNINYTHDFSLSNEIDDMIKEFFGIVYNPAQPLT